MKWIPRSTGIVLVTTLCLNVSDLSAAEKSKVVTQLDAMKSAVETAAGKVEGNKEAAAELDKAKAALKYADERYNAGKSMFGFGDISPDIEKEIKVSVETAEVATATALSKVEFVRATAELAAMEKQYAAVTAKLKIFEDRKAELERLRQESAAFQKAVKELETLKAEKAALTSQVEQLAVERNRADKLKIEQMELARSLEEMKAENTRLSSQLEKQSAEQKNASAGTAAAASADDPKKKAAKKPEKQ